MEFIHKISKGSRFNQIYIPQALKSEFEVGDIVQVKLIKKKQHHHLSKNLKLNTIKESLSKQILASLSYLNIKQIFIVGSFLIKKDYNDIDILIVSDKNIEEKVNHILAEKFEMNFHIITMSSQVFKRLIKICPLTRSMLYSFVSNHSFSLPSQELDKNHINFLLMMPQDILKLDVKSRAYYDSLRRLIVIEKFLNNQENQAKIESESESLLGNFLFSQLKDNEQLNQTELEKVKKIIRSKLNSIEKQL